MAPPPWLPRETRLVTHNRPGDHHDGQGLVRKKISKEGHEMEREGTTTHALADSSGAGDGRKTTGADRAPPTRSAESKRGKAKMSDASNDRVRLTP